MHWDDRIKTDKKASERASEKSGWQNCNITKNEKNTMNEWMNGNINALTRKNNNICCVCVFVLGFIFRIFHFSHLVRCVLFFAPFFPCLPLLFPTVCVFCKLRIVSLHSNCLLFFISGSALCNFYVSRQLQFVVCHTKRHAKQYEYIFSKQQ